MLGVHAVVWAAPSTMDEPAASPPPQSRITPNMASGGRAAGEDRAVDLLIQMQSRSAGLEFNERKPLTDGRELRIRPMSSNDGRAGTQAQDSAPVNASGLFGSAAVPTTQGSRVNGNETRVNADGPTASALQGRAAKRSEPSETPWYALLPREIVEYLRENRLMVMSTAAAVALLIWAGSVAFSRHRG